MINASVHSISSFGFSLAASFNVLIMSFIFVVFVSYKYKTVSRD
jgi:hypothetical protein